MEVTPISNNKQTTFNAGVKNSQVLKKVIENASDQELSMFNSILDAMPLRLDGKIFEFAESLSNGMYQLCMNDVIRRDGAIKSWHSKDLVEGKVIGEVYSKALKRANEILGKTYLYPTDKIKDAPREISLAEIYSKLAN